MTAAEAARSMREIADAVERIGTSRLAAFPQPMLEGDAALGAAALLCYIRDVVTNGERQTYGVAEILVLLECVSRDPEIFPVGTGILVWGMKDEALT